MASLKITATKNGMTKTFTPQAWNLLPSNKNGWTMIESNNVEAPPEVRIPLPEKVSIKKEEFTPPETKAPVKAKAKRSPRKK